MGGEEERNDHSNEVYGDDVEDLNLDDDGANVNSVSAEDPLEHSSEAGCKKASPAQEESRGGDPPEELLKNESSRLHQGHHVPAAEIVKSEGETQNALPTAAAAAVDGETVVLESPTGQQPPSPTDVEATADRSTENANSEGPPVGQSPELGGGEKPHRDHDAAA